jgi:hypothetical protein
MKAISLFEDSETPVGPNLEECTTPKCKIPNSDKLIAPQILISPKTIHTKPSINNKGYSIWHLNT